MEVEWLLFSFFIERYKNTTFTYYAHVDVPEWSNGNGTSLMFPVWNKRAGLRGKIFPMKPSGLVPTQVRKVAKNE